MPKTTIYFGPPGTGKTATLLERVKDEMCRGTDPRRIAVVAFSVRAAQEARRRVREEMGLEDEELKHWRTLHSTAARQLGVGPTQLMDKADWGELEGLTNMSFKPLDDDDRVYEQPQRQGHTCQALYGLHRATGMLLEDVWKGSERTVALSQLQRFRDTLELYKSRRGVMDYPDLLDNAPGGLDVDVALIDEAQDLTPAQWRFALRVLCKAKRLYVAGDDDQAIYDWSGGNVSQFLALEGERIVLGESHRLPRRIYDLAQGLLQRMRTRQDKTWTHSGREGSVARVPSPETVDVGRGDWLLLARTQYQLAAWEGVCRRRGVRYLRQGRDSIDATEAQAIRAWETLRGGRQIDGDAAIALCEVLNTKRTLDPAGVYSSSDLSLTPEVTWHVALKRIPEKRRAYYGACVRRDPKALVTPARVTVSTIHGAKGAEASQVATLTDVSPAIERRLRSDGEHRVWYVAATRAKEHLSIVRPQTDLGYIF